MLILKEKGKSCLKRETASHYNEQFLYQYYQSLGTKGR